MPRARRICSRWGRVLLGALALSAAAALHAQQFPARPVRLVVPYPAGGANDIVARPHLESGKIKGLGVTTARRSMALPNLPTIAEAGLPGYEVSGWYGLVAPTTTPKAAIDRLHAAVQVALRQPGIKEKLLGVGVEAVDGTAAQFGEKIRVELAKWEKVVKPLGIKPE